MKNNEWDVPSDYFEKNKKALMPVRKFPTVKWILLLAAACAVGVGLFLWKGKEQTQEIAKVEEKVREDIGSKNLSTEIEEEKVREGNIEEDKKGEEKLSEGKRREDIVEDLKEIPREELVAYLLEQDSELIENLN
jgi:hypothetical protein